MVRSLRCFGGTTLAVAMDAAAEYEAEAHLHERASNVTVDA